jgi:phospholipid-translocating ATPase
LGFANYLRRFVPRFAHHAKPLTDLLGGPPGRPFIWGAEQQAGFEAIKKGVCSTPCVVPPDYSLPFVIYTDASDFAVGAALMQDQGKGEQPIEYFSRKMEPRETRYKVMDKELLAIKQALGRFRHTVHGRPTTLYTDHKNIIYLIASDASKIACHRQARSVEFISAFLPALEIVYIKGEDNRADALSRRPDLALTALAVNTEEDFLERLADAYAEDDNYANGDWVAKNKLVKDGDHWILPGKDGEGDRYCVPSNLDLRREIMLAMHDHPASGHACAEKTRAAVAERFWWPRMIERRRRRPPDALSGRPAAALPQLSPLPYAEERGIRSRQD